MRSDALAQLSGVMGLGATSGQVITVSADGPDAAEAVAALIAILESYFFDHRDQVKP